MFDTKEAKMSTTQSHVLSQVIDAKKFSSRYEVKELETFGFDFCKDVQVRLVIGLKGCDWVDDHYSFFIGPRGGLFYYNKNHAMVRCDRWGLKTCSEILG